MNKKLPLISLFIMSIISILYWILIPKDEYYEAKWNVPDTTLAITINGEISTTFPTTNAYTGTVECTSGTGKVEWKNSKWVLTTSAITQGGTKCNVTFNKKITFAEIILAKNEVKAPITTPGKEESAKTEALLASTEDDYGTSYYFRGSVTNNYVEFANKCWRIVRIGGNGAVKLILHNDNTSKATNPCDSSNNSTSAAFARYSGAEYTSMFNPQSSDNTYVGFMYGTTGATDYASTHANTNKSTILTNLETWYNNNLKTYESVIDDTVWCNDKTNITDTTYNPWDWSGVNGLGYAENATYYGATQRLVSADGVAGGPGPSLKCNGELSKINSKVGLITADEIAFAGNKYGYYKYSTYLQENATDIDWWTMSPVASRSLSVVVWAMRDSGSLITNFVYQTCGVRPSIALISSTTISGGSGTSEDPYVVN